MGTVTREAVKTGLVLDIQRMSTEDGPGLRTTVFLKGCPLRCEWCHNPESISPDVEIEYFADQCIGCGLCIEGCEDGALQRGPAGIVRAVEKCTGCLNCCSVCPTQAMRAKGETRTADELAGDLSKDSAYFGTDGGVTVSGGEALFQPEFTAGLLQRLKARNIGTAVDTCGLCPWTAIESVLPFTDIFLYDIKVMDPEEHKRYTGADNGLILENLKKLSVRLRSEGSSLAGKSPAKRLWIRTPVIPGATDSAENIRKIAKFINMELAGCVERWELCAFNNLCSAKYRRFGKEWKYENASLISPSEMSSLKDAAVSTGLSPDMVFTTGMTAKEKPGKRSTE